MIVPIAISLLLGVAASAQGSLDCAACHADIANSFARTAHAKASASATAESIAGTFNGTLRTSAPGVYFQMERRDGRFFQTGFDHGTKRTEPFDLVIGSGRRGQSYLYWRQGLLFQLPVSYHVSTRQWINSPGYEDGTVNFDRAIPPQCLDCHASNFRLHQTTSGPRYRDEYSLGIQCGKCHGEAQRHEQILRPSSLDLCARCHSGLKEESHGAPDVHGNQVGLLKESRCFQQSGSMTCGTCHDVHRLERSPAALSAKCGLCHTTSACPRAGGNAVCAECHMPLVQSKLIQVQTYRTHRIGIYRKESNDSARPTPGR